MYFESMLQCKLTGQHVFELPIDDFNRIYLDLLSKNHAERMAIPGMIPMRADMIVVAATLIDFILQLIPIRSITCSHYALKEGAISRLLIAEQTA
jgi:exopolyphosphatase/guanosine-5'-triphosphate,3'-diphosphate pyrophosphatase